MNKKLIALLSVLAVAVSMVGCGDVSDPNDSSAVQSSAVSEEAKETSESISDLPEIEPVPIPEGGWTEETISEVIYVNGYNIKLPCDFEELSNKVNILIDEDHLYFFQNGQGASTEIEYNGAEVGCVSIYDYTNENTINDGKIYGILCDSDYNETGENNYAPININGIELGSDFMDVESNLDFDKDEPLGGWCYYRKSIGEYYITIGCKEGIVNSIGIAYIYE